MGINGFLWELTGALRRPPRRHQDLRNDLRISTIIWVADLRDLPDMDIPLRYPGAMDTR